MSRSALASDPATHPSFAGAHEALAALAAAGPEQAAAWAWIVERWGPGLLGTAQRICGEAHLAEDAVQEALLHIRDGAGRFRPPAQGDPAAAAAAWLLAVGRHAALGLIRRRHRARHRERRWQHAEAIRRQDQDQPSAGSGSGRRAGARLRAELAELPVGQREILVMHYLEGRPYEEIARRQGISVGNARIRAHRGLERLRSRLGRAGAALTALVLGGQLRELAAATLLTAPSPTATAAWTGLLGSTTCTTALPAVAVFGGLTTMAKTLIAAACLAAAGIAIPLTNDLVGAERHEERAERHEEGTRHREGEQGVLVGILAGFGHGPGAIEVTDEHGVQHLFRPRWIGGLPKDGGGPDQAMVKQVRDLRPGAKVQVGWIIEEGPRVIALQALANGPDRGHLEGTIVEIDQKKGIVIIENESGRHRFMPHWRGGMPADGGGLDRATIEAVGAFAVGDRVGIDWTWEERMRIEHIGRPRAR